MINTFPLAWMGDDEFIRHAKSNLDPLTSTDLERELLIRLENVIDTAIDHEPIDDALEAACLDVKQLKSLLELLEEFNVDTPNALRAKLERADAFYDIANEAGDLFDRLTQLIHTTH